MLLTDEERHRAVYGTPHVPPFAYQAIGDDRRLWHGRNPLTAQDITELAGHGITHVLDLREQWEWAAPGRFGADAVEALERSAIVRRHVPVGDGGIPAPEQFDAAIEFLDQARNAPDTRTYVHCRLGRERTGAVLVAWESLRHDTSCAQALDALNAQGAKLDPLPYQMEAAQAWVSARRRRAAGK